MTGPTLSLTHFRVAQEKTIGPLGKCCKQRASYNIGEMAHIIAHSGRGPRGQGQSGPVTYENLILLCPSCHTTADKDPIGHPPELLRWKDDHEKQIREAGASLQFGDVSALKLEVTRLLQENHRIWKRRTEVRYCLHRSSF
jgi:HNH endonuclease